MKIIFRSYIKRIFQHEQMTHISGFGKDAVFERKLTDWYIDIQGIGPVKAATAAEGRPDFNEGDSIRATIERG